MRLLLSVAAAVFALAAGQPASHANPTKGLKQVLEDQEAAWNRGDLKAFMQTYSESPDLTFFSGDTIIKGRQSTLERYQKKYGSDGKGMGQLSFTDEQIQQMGADAALVMARWHLAMPDGQKREGLTTVILRREPSGWKIIHDHSS